MINEYEPMDQMLLLLQELKKSAEGKPGSGPWTISITITVTPPQPKKDNRG